MNLSTSPCLQNLVTFQDSSFPWSLIPLMLITPTSLWREPLGMGQSSWGHKLTQNVQKEGHSPMFLALSSHSRSPTGLVQAARVTGRWKQPCACDFITFQPFIFAGEVNPSTSTDFLSYLLGLCPAEPGQAGFPSSAAAGRAGTNQSTKLLLCTYCWPLPLLLSWWSWSEKWFLMATVFSKAWLPFSVWKTL